MVSILGLLAIDWLNRSVSCTVTKSKLRLHSSGRSRSVISWGSWRQHGPQRHIYAVRGLPIDMWRASTITLSLQVLSLHEGSNVKEITTVCLVTYFFQGCLLDIDVLQLGCIGLGEDQSLDARAMQCQACQLRETDIGEVQGLPMIGIL